MLNRSLPGRPQRGLSLVEMLVGVAVGLFVVAGATAVVGGQLGDTRRLISETQLQQDLRSAADIITREMRRAGYTSVSYEFVWSDGTGPQSSNTLMTMSPTTTAGSTTEFSYFRATNSVGPFGFRLNNETIQMQLGSAGWMDLTDSRVMKVTEFNVAPRLVASTQLPCPKNCADGTTACWPTITVREFDVSITAKSRNDEAVERKITSTVRPRNDRLDYNDGDPSRLCPI